MKRSAILVAVALMGAPATAVSFQAGFAEPWTWGPSAHGLRMGLLSVRSGILPPDGAGFYVALRNAGDSDFVINLGYMLGNGKAMFPSAVRLILTGPGATTRELQFFDRRCPGVGGRIDDYIVSLRAGSTYTLRVTLENYWSPATKEFELRLADGRYRITAQFEGHGATSVNLDMGGVALLNFWTGSVQSDALEFEVSKQAAPN